MLNLKKISNHLARPTLLNYVLPILMVYLTIGTVAQKYIGLYEAKKIFFSSPLIWLGFVPLPGLPILLGLIFVNLCFKLFFKSPWTSKNAGVIITHIGVMLLLLGGLFTALFSTEGYMDFASGQQKSAVNDYHIRELVLTNAEGTTLKSIDHTSLKPQDKIRFDNENITIEILETCRNCEIKERRPAQESFIGQENFIGMAQHMELHAAPLRHNDDVNMAGVTFALQGSDTDGVYVTLEDVPKRPEISIKDQNFEFILRKQQRTLPFTVELLEFKRDMHPGTTLAKSYSSRVRIIDGASQWESLISMNEPLRYKGYTLFQSSFIETPEGDVSVLAVVWNAGRVFPYISGIVLCIGMLIHLFMRRCKNLRTAEAKHAA